MPQEALLGVFSRERVDFVCERGQEKFFGFRIVYNSVCYALGCLEEGGVFPGFRV